MKNLKKNIIFVALTLLTFAITACGNEEIEPVNIAIIAGIADGETHIKEGIEELAMLSAMPGTEYAFISIDGTPSCISEGIIPDLSDRGYTRTMMEKVKAGIQADLMNRLATFTPDSTEIDMSGAIELAVRKLKANTVEEGRRNILLLYCSGRSSVSLINMKETPIYKLDIEKSALAIAESMNVDMHGIEVVFYCCGDVGDGQPRLSDNERTKMKEFYEQLFLALGAERVTFKEDLPSSESYHFEDYPVSCMEVEDTVSGLQEVVILKPEIFEGADETALKEPIVIPEKQVEYKSNSAVFKDPKAAASAIQPIIDYMTEYPDISVLIYGTCAGDKDTQNTLQLSRDRAQSVKDLLLSAGIAQDRITIVTVRIEDDPYYQYGLGTGSEASVNRKCVIMDLSSDLARQLLANAI